MDRAGSDEEPSVQEWTRDDEELSVLDKTGGDEDSILYVTGDNEDSKPSGIRNYDTVIQE